jgi:PIN domain nuclease of toxin-antitoxin system
MTSPLNLLLDTHILIWWLTASNRLSKTARQVIVDADSVYVSAASIWEIAIKVARGKLQVEGDLQQHLAGNQFQELPVRVAHAVAAARLPRHHGDPFDRMLAAQAARESLTLLTSDERLKAYDVSILLA